MGITLARAADVSDKQIDVLLEGLFIVETGGYDWQDNEEGRAACLAQQRIVVRDWLEAQWRNGDMRQGFSITQSSWVASSGSAYSNKYGYVPMVLTASGYNNLTRPHENYTGEIGYEDIDGNPLPKEFTGVTTKV
jgi:hypothetical protein